MMKLGVGFIAAGAALTAFGQETTQVQLYGLVGAYVAKSERSGGPAAVTQLGHGGLTTSYWGVRGTEALGSGYKAIFALESFFQTDTGGMGRNATDPLFSRNAYVGFEGGFGKLTFGRQTNPTYVNMGTLSPFGVSVVFSPLVLQSFIGTYNGALVGDTVWNNTIQYTMPRIAGLGGSVMYGLGEVAGGPGTANIGLHANYVNGNFGAAFSAQRFRTPVTAPLTQQDAYLLGATYDFKVVKLYGSVVKTDASGTTNDTRTYDVGVRIPVSKSGALLAEWAHTKRTRAGVPDNERHTGSVGYDYFLSKRTDVYAVYSRDRQTGFGSTGTIGMGVRHTF
ncbi:porin [Noviherbaspirillum saxi]|nr:porin [Noviherbaspirillum saxi]